MYQPDPNGKIMGNSIAFARRFNHRYAPNNVKITNRPLYAQDADGIKYTFANAMKAAAEMLKLKYVIPRNAEKLNDGEYVKTIARSIINGCEGGLKRKENRHRLYGFDWFYQS